MARATRSEQPPRIAIIGAGPIGLEAALYARRLEWPVTVYEVGQVGQYVRAWGHVRMFSPFGWNSTSLGRQALLRDQPKLVLPALTELQTGSEWLDSYLVPISQSSALQPVVQCGRTVHSIGRAGFLRHDPSDDPKRIQQPFRLLVTADKVESIEQADVVLDCTGVFGHHRWIGDGGIPARGEARAKPLIAYGLEDVLGDKQKQYEGRSILVVGSGYSAATTIANLAKLAEVHQATWMIWLVRGNRSQPIARIPNDPLKERDKLAVRVNMLATRGEGNCEFHPSSYVEAIESHGPDKGFRVEARCAGKTMSWEVERVIGQVGYRPAMTICTELHAVTPESGTVASGEPNYYFLGMKSYGRDSNFLLRDGHDQIRALFAKLTGKPNLDFYADKG